MSVTSPRITKMILIQGRTYLDPNDTVSLLPRNAMEFSEVFVEEINKRLSELQKIRLLIYKDWDKTINFINRKRHV